MKRWLPIAFLGLSLLAKLIGHAYSLSRPAVWPPVPSEHYPAALEAFSFASGPVCLAMLLILWKPDALRKAELGTPRLHLGTALLGVTAFAWLFFILQWLQAGWVASTPTQYPLQWMDKSIRMYRFADVSLLVGGAFSLWLKGIRMPPRNGDDMK